MIPSTIPNDILVRNLPAGGVRNVALEVRTLGKLRSEDLTVSSSDEWIQCTFDPAASKVVVALRPNWSGGDRTGTIFVRRKSSPGELKVPVRVGVLPFFKAAPGRIFVEGRSAGAREPHRVRVACTSAGSDLQITRTTLEGLVGTATARRDAGGADWIVELTFDLKPKPPLEKGLLVIGTTNAVAPEIRVPVMINWLE